MPSVSTNVRSSLSGLGTRTYVLRLLVLAAGYVSVSYLSLFLIPPATGGGWVASIVWPPSAIAVAALFFFGFELWPALLLPLFFLFLGNGLTPPLAASVALGNLAEALLGAYLLRRFDFRPMFDRLQDALVFTFVSVIAPLASATLITLTAHWLLGTASIELLWLGLWIGHMVTLLSFGAFAVRWGYKPFFERSRRQWLEGVGMFALFVALSAFTYWSPYNTIGTISLLYVSIIPLIWAALRAGPRGMTLALAIMALIASTGTLWGYGTLAHSLDPRQTLLSIQLVVGVLSLIFLLFTSIVEERKEAVIALQANVERLQSAVEQIRSEDQAKSDFIAILAHELRNPLSPILSSLEVLQRNTVRPENVPLVESMTTHVHVMARLLDDLLDMSRISQKKFKLQREPVRLNSSVAQSLEMAAPYIAERRHTLTVVEPDEELWLSADPVRVSQIIVNLLTNAAKYTDSGGTIRLETRRANGEAIIEVTDSGIGIDPQRLKKIFEPFGATDSGVRRAGLHIGLSLAKRMAELHQGTIDVRSAGPGKGSTFTVRLPLLSQAPLIAPESIGPRRRTRSKKELFGRSRALGVLKILVVDDNEAAADSLAQLLRHNGHETKVAYSGEQAVEMTQEYEPTVALLDIGLPGMDGYQLAGHMRERFGDEIMLVALTGYGQAEDKQKAQDAGFDDHLTKPVSIVDVEHVLLELSRA